MRDHMATKKLRSWHKLEKQPDQYPAYGLPKPRRNHCCCFAWICSILVIIAVLLGVVILITWLVLQPRALRFSVGDVHVVGLNSTSFGTGSNHGNTVTTFQLVARNPNEKVGIVYDKITANVQTMGVDIGNGDLMTFYQGHKNTTEIDGYLSSEGLSTDADTQDAILKSQSDGSLPLEMTFDISARPKIGSVKPPKFTRFHLSVHCNLKIDNRNASETNNYDTPCKTRRR